MPYIKHEDRDKIDPLIDALVDAIKGHCDDAGMLTESGDNLDGILNYCFFRICTNMYPASYHWYNRMIGMMECCKLELYRRVVSKYEDEKINSNGDVI